jgi:hypothetical protein
MNTGAIPNPVNGAAWPPTRQGIELTGNAEKERL